MILEKVPSADGERMNSRAMGDNESMDEEGDAAALLLLVVVAMVETEVLRPAAFCTLRSVARVSLRKTRSKSSLYPGHVRRVLAHWLHVGLVSSHFASGRENIVNLTVKYEEDEGTFDQGGSKRWHLLLSSASGTFDNPLRACRSTP